MNKTQLLEEYDSHSAEETQNIGRAIYQQFKWPCCVYLIGDLGAGKTTLCKSIIAAAGHAGVVTSPTYNLIQEYPVNSINSEQSGSTNVINRTIFHMDLYRLNDAQELYYLGLTDLWQSTSMFLVEWPEKGGEILQGPDYIIEISKKLRSTEEIRKVSLFQCF